MLGLFPKPYPDELIYSVLARYFVRSGYNKYVFAAEDLFSKKTKKDKVIWGIAKYVATDILDIFYAMSE